MVVAVTRAFVAFVVTAGLGVRGSIAIVDFAMSGVATRTCGRATGKVGNFPGVPKTSCTTCRMAAGSGRSTAAPPGVIHGLTIDSSTARLVRRDVSTSFATRTRERISDARRSVVTLSITDASMAGAFGSIFN